MAAISENIAFSAKMKKKQKSKKGGRKKSQLHSTGGGGLVIFSNPGNRIIPDIYSTKLTYSSRVTLTTTTGSLATTQFSANSCYDPYVPSGGSVPEGYTILSSLYVNFRVVKFWVEVIFTNVGTTAPTQNMECCISVEPTAVAPSTIEAMRSAPYKVWKCFNGVTNPMNKLKMSMSIAKLFGVEPVAVLSDARYSGVSGSFGSGANPTDNGIINVGVQSVDRSSTVVCQCYVSIVYDVEWYNRQTFSTQA